MKYKSKRVQRLQNKFKDFDLNREIEKKFSIYSRGGKIERSFKQRIGKRINKNLDDRLKKYNTANLVLKKINNVLTNKN